MEIVYNVDKKCYLISEKLEDQYSIVKVTNDTIKATSFVQDENGELSIIGIPQGQYCIKCNSNQDHIGYVSIGNSDGLFQIGDFDFSLDLEIVKNVPEEYNNPSTLEIFFSAVIFLLFLIIIGIIVVSICAVVIYTAKNA